MKILEYGNPEPYTVRCDCGCKFIWELEDVKHDDGYHYPCNYVTCPECALVIEVHIPHPPIENEGW